MLRVAVVVVGALAVSVSTPVTTAAGVASVWPGHGQAAYAIGEGPVHVGSRARAAPIASMAKVMTAYVVLAKRPVATGADGFMLTVTARDVRDRAMRLGRGESTVPVRAGERLTERQALAALLLPSANNVAIMLARRVYGSVRAFVRAMNAAGRHLGLRHTTYTDPSGYETSTRSTPADQVLLARAATRVPFLRAMVRRTAQWIPVAGTVRNTDALLGHEGFVGLKTGSMSQSGGCLMFRTRRVIGGHAVDVYGVVMGQSNNSGLLPAAFDAVRRFANRITPQVAPRSQWR